MVKKPKNMVMGASKIWWMPTISTLCHSRIILFRTSPWSARWTSFMRGNLWNRISINSPSNCFLSGVTFSKNMPMEASSNPFIENFVSPSTESPFPNLIQLSIKLVFLSSSWSPPVHKFTNSKGCMKVLQEMDNCLSMKTSIIWSCPSCSKRQK